MLSTSHTLATLPARVSQDRFWASPNAKFWCVPFSCNYTAKGNLFAWVDLPGGYCLTTFGADAEQVQIGKFCGISLVRSETDEEREQRLEDEAVDYWCTSEADYTNWAE